MRLADLPDRSYRLLGTAAMWGLFGVVGLLIGFVVLPFVSLFVRNPDRRQSVARQIIGTSFKLFIIVASGARLISCHVSGMQHYRPRSGQLILANHPSLIDVVILISLFPEVDCVIKEAITRNPVLKMSVGAANYISNAEPAELLEACSERLRSGANLTLFPEGTRTVPGEPIQFKAGAAEIALRAEADVLPIVISCRPAFLAKHEPWYRIPPSRPRFDIRVLPPIEPREYVKRDMGDRAARQALNSRLLELFEAELA